MAHAACSLSHLCALQANNKFDGLNQMLNIVQSIQLPFALIPVRAGTAGLWRSSSNHRLAASIHCLPHCALDIIAVKMLAALPD